MKVDPKIFVLCLLCGSVIVHRALFKVHTIGEFILLLWSQLFWATLLNNKEVGMDIFKKLFLIMSLTSIIHLLLFPLGVSLVIKYFFIVALFILCFGAGVYFFSLLMGAGIIIFLSTIIGFFVVSISMVCSKIQK
jgi:hypothetical protein